MENNLENSGLVVVQNKHSQRFEIALNEGNYAFLDYRWSGKHLALLHVEVPKDWQRKGLAAMLVNHVLDFVKKEQIKIKPFCPYVIDFLRNNLQYQSFIEKTFTIA